MSDPARLAELVDLAAERVGGAVLVATDEFFAPKENLLKAGPAVWREGEYTDRGKWMDGWETRRRRTAGHDWCVVRLGIPGAIRAVIVDTSFFRGNFPEHCSLEAASLEREPAPEELASASFFEVLPRSSLEGHAPNTFEIADPRRFTHLRLHIYPDGGVARLRVFGEAIPDVRRLARGGGHFDLAAVENGGAVVVANDMFFGSRHNLIMPGRSTHMGDGWETRRRRSPKLWEVPAAEAPCDWVVVRLGAEGHVARVEVDTNHFKGNFPESCRIDGALAEPGAGPESLAAPGRSWDEVLPRTALRAHTRHLFEEELRARGPFTHLRLSIFPDGGVSRLRVFGAPSEAGLAHSALRWLNALPEDAARSELERACGARRFAAAVAARRPFTSAARLLEAAEAALRDLTRDDWLEAFAAHPRIGSRRDLAAQSSATRALAEGEQGGARSAAEETLAALEEGNHAYEERFGHIYIVCASGRSAAEMLEILRARLANAPDVELRVASAEQEKITRIRLEKMLKPEGPR